MNVSLEYSKTLAGEGAILLLLSLVPYAGWILGIIGVILLLRGMKELSNYYQDEEIYKNSLTGVKFYIIAIVAAGVAIAAITIGIWSATGFTFTTGFVSNSRLWSWLNSFLSRTYRCFRILHSCNIAPKKNLQYTRTKIRRNIVYHCWYFALVGSHINNNPCWLNTDIYRLDICHNRILHNETSTTATIQSTTICIPLHHQHQPEQGKVIESKALNYNNHTQSETLARRGI